MRYRGSVKCGALNASFPFGSLSIREDHIRLGFVFFSRHIRFDDIERIEKIGERSIYIHHKKKFPKIYFWSLKGNIVEIQLHLHTLGIKIW